MSQSSLTVNRPLNRYLKLYLTILSGIAPICGQGDYNGEGFRSDPFKWYGMSEATLDDRGRLTLPKELRERHGDRYQVVELGDGIKLIPVAKDPLAALRDEFADADATGMELRKQAREDALDQAGR